MRKRDKRILTKVKQLQRERMPEDQGHIDRLLDAIREHGTGKEPQAQP